DAASSSMLIAGLVLRTLRCPGTSFDKAIMVMSVIAFSPSPAREEPRRAMLALHAGMRGQGRRAQRPLTARSRAACDTKGPGAVRGVIADAKRLPQAQRRPAPNSGRQN